MAHFKKNGNTVEWTTQFPALTLFIEAPCLVENRLFIGHRDDSIKIEAGMVMFGDLGQIPLHNLNTRENAIR
jgi:hypothetical protein